MILESARIRREFTRFFKFTVVGSIGAIVDFGTFNLLQILFGVPYLLSGTVSFSAAVGSNFIWNRFWTYPDSRSKPIARQATQFLLVNAIGLLIRIPVLAIAEKPMIQLAAIIQLPSMGIIELLPPLARIETAAAGRNLALALAVLMVLFWNFTVNRVWTYSDVE